MRNKKQDKQLEKLLFEVYDKGVKQQDCNLTDYIEKVKQALRIHAVSSSVCDECGDGSGWYGDDIEPEYGSITMNCSKCNPEAN